MIKIWKNSYVSTHHHTITDDLVSTLCNNHKDYIRKLRSYGFQNQFLSDIELLYNKGDDVRTYKKGNHRSYVEEGGLNVICPFCQSFVKIPKLSDIELEEYIGSLEPAYILDPTE